MASISLNNLTLEEAKVMAEALEHYRAVQAFNANALHATEEESQQANRKCTVIDLLLNDTFHQQALRNVINVMTGEKL